jgi:AcrR family transcriptional regulator
MPKIVDHEERREQIAEAAWRVILKQGMKGATVRNIAKEAGLSLGALRHYFSTQDELIFFAMNLVKERVTARINLIAAQDLPPKQRVYNILLELVPVDEQKLAEMEVWYAFTFHVKYMNSASELDDGIYPGMVRLIEYLDASGLLREGLDKEIEAERLYAVVNGTALHALLEPGRLRYERVAQVLKQHLDSICKAEPGEEDG